MKLTDEELRVLELSAQLYNAIFALGDHHPSDMDELAIDIHRIQNRVMARLAVRAHPNFFVARQRKRLLKDAQ